MKKLMHVAGLAVDLAYPVLLIVIGVAVIIGGATQTLWL